MVQQRSALIITTLAKGDLRASPSNPTILAADLGQLCSSMALGGGSVQAGVLFLAVAWNDDSVSETWVLRIEIDRVEGEVVGVDHYATLDTGHNVELLFITLDVHESEARDFLMAVSRSSTIRLWCITSTKRCIDSERNFVAVPVSSAVETCRKIASFAVKDHLLALGKCNGEVILVDVVLDQADADIEHVRVVFRQIGVINVNAALSTHGCVGNPPSGLRSHRELAKTVSGQSSGDNGADHQHLDVDFSTMKLAFLLDEAPAAADELYQSIVGDCKDSLILASNVGLIVLDVRSREIVASVITDATITGRCGKLAVCASKTCNVSEFNVKLASEHSGLLLFRLKKEEAEEALTDSRESATASVVADEIIRSDSFLRARETGHQKVCKKAPAVIKSSGYGRPHRRRKMFVPMTNIIKHGQAIPRHKEGNLGSEPALQSNKDDHHYHLHHLEGDSNEGGRKSLGRPRWSRPDHAKSRTKNGIAATQPPSSCSGARWSLFCRSTFQAWQTEGAKTRLALRESAANDRGPVVAAFASHHDIVQVLPNAFNMTAKSSVKILSGHGGGRINSVHFSHGGDRIVSADNNVIKVWNWRHGNTDMTVSTYVGSGGQAREQTGVAHLYGGNQDRNRRAEDRLPFPDPLAKVQFYFLDQFILSTCGNLVLIHRLWEEHRSRPSPPSLSCRLAKKFVMNTCKVVTDLTAINHFYSMLVLMACSDKSLRILDLHAEVECLAINDCHQKRAPDRIVQPHHVQNLTSDVYNLFATCAMCDGAKLWDLRGGGGGAHRHCVQKFEWPSSSSGRISGGIDFSGCMRYLACGADDGSIYIFDLRRTKSYVQRLCSGRATTSAITDVKFLAGNSHVASSNQTGQIDFFTQ